MAVDLALVHTELLRMSVANAAGDLEASQEASTLLKDLANKCEIDDDESASERLLRFLLDVTMAPMPEAESVRALLCDCVLEVLPRLLSLAATSAAALACGVALVERRLVAVPRDLHTRGMEQQQAAAGLGAGCNPRELLTALLELYDILRETAPDSPLQLHLLLRLLRFLPLLVAAVQRRRLQVALSCLPAVSDLAVAAASRLAAVRMAAEAVATASRFGGCDVGSGRDSVRDRTVMEAEAMWAEAEHQLVSPFVSFVIELHQQVLSSELRMDSHLSQTNATTSHTSTVSPSSGPGSRPEWLHVAAWLMALIGALWPAWGIRGHLGRRCGEEWGGASVATPLMQLLLQTYLQQPSMGVASWRELWAVAEVEAGDTELEVLSDSDLSRLGAATVIWLSATAPRAAGLGESVAACVKTTRDVHAGNSGSDSCSGRLPGGSVCEVHQEPQVDDHLGALKVLLESCLVLIRRTSREDSVVLLTRAMQLLESGCNRLRLVARAPANLSALLSEASVHPDTAIQAGGAIPANAAACGPGNISSVVIFEGDDPWVKIARRLQDQPSTTSTATDLYEMLEPYCPHFLDEREAALEPLVQSVATMVALQVAHGSPGPDGEAARTLAHTALQALTSALPPLLRAVSLSHLAGGPSTEVAALALQRLQREVATAICAPAGSGGGGGSGDSVFSGPWVLRPVVQQLLHLLSLPLQQLSEGTATATMALAHRADAAAAALNLIRFLAIRHRAEVHESGNRVARGGMSAGSRGVEAVGEMEAALALLPTVVKATDATDPSTQPASSTATATKSFPTSCPNPVEASVTKAAAAARIAVLTAVYNAAVHPLCSIMSFALNDLQRRVQLEEAEEGEKATSLEVSCSSRSQRASPSPVVVCRAAATAMPGVAVLGAEGVEAERFASNVAVVSEAVGGLTAVSRLQEVAGWLGELLGTHKEGPRVQEVDRIGATVPGATTIVDDVTTGTVNPVATIATSLLKD